jgi:hypothetical protein
MSGFYDCWDLGGLDTTLNSYLANIRAPKKAADIPPDPPAVAAHVPAASTGSAAAFTNYPPEPPQPQLQIQNRQQQPLVKSPKIASTWLNIMLSPMACIFLWMLCVVLITMILTRKKKKRRRKSIVPAYRYIYRDAPRQAYQ